MTDCHDIFTVYMLQRRLSQHFLIDRKLLIEDLLHARRFAVEAEDKYT
jgi:hypothetical protein